MLYPLMIGAAMAAGGSALHEVSVELGTLGSRDRNTSMFAYGDQLSSGGGRVGYAVADRWAVVADYQVGRHGGWLDSAPDGAYISSLMDLTLHQVTVGPKYSVAATKWLRPYATVQAMGVAGRLRLAEDADEPEDREGYWSLAPGGVAALGVDVVTRPLRPEGARLGSHLELGYGHATALSFSDRDAGNEAAELGDMKLGGFYLRWGVGVRF